MESHVTHFQQNGQILHDSLWEKDDLLRRKWNLQYGFIIIIIIT